MRAVRVLCTKFVQDHTAVACHWHASKEIQEDPGAQEVDWPLLNLPHLRKEGLPNALLTLQCSIPWPLQQA